jgi:hypothetical protein
VARLCDPCALAEGSTWNSARSWASVSRIKAVMSCEPNSAVVKIRGGGNLDACVSTEQHGQKVQQGTDGKSAMALEDRVICSK